MPTYTTTPISCRPDYRSQQSQAGSAAPIGVLHSAKAGIIKQPPLKSQSFCYRTASTMVWAIGLLLVLSQMAQAQVSGTVFRDYNANGLKETTEGGVTSVTVTAFFNATVATAVSTTAGSYSFSAAQIPNTTPVRLEFSGFPTGDFSGPFSAAAAGSGTSVQFVTAGQPPTLILELTCQTIFVRLIRPLPYPVMKTDFVPAIPVRRLFLFLMMPRIQPAQKQPTRLLLR